MKANQIRRITIDFKMDVTKTKIYIKQLDLKYILSCLWLAFLNLITLRINVEHDEISISMGYIEMFNHLHPRYFPQNSRHVFLFVVFVLFYLLMCLSWW